MFGCILWFCWEGSNKALPTSPMGIPCVPKPCDCGVLTQEMPWLPPGRLARVSGTKHLPAWGRLLSCWLRAWGWPRITSVSVCCQGIWWQIYCGQKVWVNLKAGKDVKRVGRWCVNYFYPRQGKAIFWSTLGCRRKSWLLTATKADNIWNLNHFFFSIHQPSKCCCQTKMPQGCRGTNKSKWRGTNIHRAGGCGRSWYVGRKKYSVR